MNPDERLREFEREQAEREASLAFSRTIREQYRSRLVFHDADPAHPENRLPKEAPGADPASAA